MLRNRAVIAMIVEEVAGLSRPQVEPRAGDEPELFPGQEALARERRKAGLMAALDWAAILILLLFRREGAAFLTLGPSTEALFSLVVLAVAAHSGFRLAGLMVLRTAERLCGELAERESAA